MAAAPHSDLLALRDALRAFAEARDWGQFHTPKNLAMALIGEAAEVVEHFQWRTAEASAALPASDRAEVALELADVLLYLVRLADVLEVDLADAAQRKLAINESRYPVDKAHGRADKYTQL
ncbi:nucleotide pyrophosphohydrolase [Denitromonas halophila]|uniref:Nucleotide pyrophosphohydrolase n=1 Tax=Denitromonas halophila TaxID=1629404 RepID=A0A557QM48_9RHOO|nr:nucleotide pyrophosphohydrolase [Denitromonas halophila]TVO53972.1 nucleotide pyrophosphohydrolase [Denitromonas halophila]